jgi:hypothetical protein
MKKRLLILILIIIFIFSSSTFLLILNYLDPYENKIMAITFILITFSLSITTFFSVLLYFFKKIYFRWEVFLSNVLISFRQSFLFSLFLIWVIIFNITWTPLILSSSISFVMFIFIELLIRNLEN